MFPIGFGKILQSCTLGSNKIFFVFEAKNLVEFNNYETDLWLTQNKKGENPADIVIGMK